MKKIITGLGEILVDVFPDYVKPGGAPCNVVYNASQLGNGGVLVSSVGNDEAGLSLLDFLIMNDIDTSYIQKSVKPSGKVHVTFQGSEASYEIIKDVAWDDIRWNEKLSELAQKTDCVCFSTLSQRSEPSKSTILKFLNEVPKHCLNVLDVNLRPPFYSLETILQSCHLADVVKLNEHEFAELSGLLETDNLISYLIETCHVRLIIITLGKNGSRCVTATSDTTYPTELIDTSNGDSVGVGDAFIACVIHHLLKNTPEAEMMEKANRFAGMVAAQKGAMIAFDENDLKEVR